MILEQQITEALRSAETLESEMATQENYRKVLSMIDATTLSPCDTEASVRSFTQKIIGLSNDNCPHVASICVFPPYVESVAMEVDGTPIKITSVAGGFPASQTFLEVKTLEAAMAVENGADEIDIVISVGKFLEGHVDEVRSEIEMIRSECDDVILKVILETGELPTSEQIYQAATLAIDAGADFVKTSTGKTATSATPQAVAALAFALRDNENKSVGLKIAGGIKTAKDTIKYLAIVKTILGDSYLNKDFLRFGTSSVVESVAAEC